MSFSSSEEAQRRKNAVDARNELRGHVVAEIDIGLAQRQQVEQEVQRGAGTARAMAAIGKDLAVQLLVEIARGLAHLGG